MLKSYSRFFDDQKVLLILLLAVVLCGISKTAYCQTNRPVLLLQQMPDDVGTITPGPGVHHFEQGTAVTLTAVPKAGFQFVYWLGDVSDPHLNKTTVYLDAPKIIIAIFEKAEFDLGDLSEPTLGIPGALGDVLRASAADYSRQGFGGGGGAGRQSVSGAPAQPPQPEPLPPPEVPVPVPEPTTLVLLAVGSYMAFKGRRARK
ncbi:MAG: PEP-CTERM sorting domain-containing protein [Phycisphaerae bacterium]|nr:PEP-CTERM sorting domain-containing protein [Phycisphaerae bacterium]NIR63891.1 PEP-CTERM sorting domain-containing protein [candidate division Zixibacteria bacterium]NIP52014.1 PEP-CTERM sorting domain-containing protein [Phycisphaerae bacterium]NIS53791.1 PEP-CTERM sorting domain-containing protein [Phycisphaerae bacterium]NIU08749.1 PEP-CTERM sorting domain-containing protein [Phycisphaerae bacterium]